MKKLLLLSILSCTIFITSCSNKNIDSELKTITFVLDWLPNTNHTGIYVALHEGYYEDLGLKLEIKTPSEDGALQILASGKADLGVSYQEYIATALTSDTPIPVTAVAALIQHNTTGIISLKEKGITSPRFMEGHTYAWDDLAVSREILKSVVENDGGDFSKVIIKPESVTDALSALQSNLVDALLVFYAWDVVAISEVKGIDTNFFYSRDYNDELDFYSPLIAANQDFLKSNVDDTKAFLEATAKGYEFAIANPEKAAEIIVSYVPELDLEIAIASQKYLAGQYKAEVEQWGYIDKQRWEKFHSWLYEQQAIPKKIESGIGFTNEFLPKGSIEN
jgi:ABC-type nitrate/sulfonate/bicarbonate transport system substrate-binding protein